MSLPMTLAEIMAMGRDALPAVVRFYMPILGLSDWQITARWVERGEANDNGEMCAGSCTPNPIYEHATIEIAWPPVGDIEETIVHEMAHAARALFAMLAGAFEQGSWAHAIYERDAEQTARGMVALRRRGGRSPVVLTRFYRSKTAALRREKKMPDPVKLAELAMKAGEMAAKEDVPEEVRGLLKEFVAALAGGDAGADAGAEGGETASVEGQDQTEQQTQMSAEEDPAKAPAYMRELAAQVKSLTAAVARIAGPKPDPAKPSGAQPSAELAEMRRMTVESFLSTKPSVLSAEAERELVKSGDIKLARFMVSEVERKQVERGGHRQPGAEDKNKIKLTPAQQKAAARHKIDPEKYAMSLQRQVERKALIGRGGH